MSLSIFLAGRCSEMKINLFYAIMVYVTMLSVAQTIALNDK
jgi:hypothetical protein